MLKFYDKKIDLSMNLAILPYISALIVVNLVLSVKYEKR